MRARIRGRRPTPAFVIACVALFVAMSGVAYAANTVRSRDIVNDAVTSADIEGGGGKTGDIKNRDVNALLAVAKGFATVKGQGANGAASVLNFGGQQTATSPPGRECRAPVQWHLHRHVQGEHGNRQFVNVNSVNELHDPGNIRELSNASAEAISANENEIKIRVRLRTFNGANPANTDFAVQFYARMTS